eukprot:TRINITY_DN122278_c0_g1_i1.p1 TRINITY_DN122278_c0_g1~~TRINITY_DN122278_c0_g1_i1.p1  ORF type:complete len:277 (-),score=34.11 TRINITY_DN122278_c0_g1_i1:591-1370(-)
MASVARSRSPPSAAVSRDAGSWTKNLLFRPPSGFWGDQAWYDLQLERRLPEAATMLQELIWALPPCSGARVVDYGAGTGRAATAILQAYPTARVTLLDSDKVRGAVALQRLTAQLQQLGLPADDAHNSAKEALTFTQVVLRADGEQLPGCGLLGYDVCVAAQSIRHVAVPPAHYRQPGEESLDMTPEGISRRYLVVFQSILSSLRPGGHILMGDHVEHKHPGVFEHMDLLRKAGFVDVDVAWRYRDWFVVGARKPPVAS